MKNSLVILLLIGLTSLYSCKSKEDTAKDIVENFMKQINDDKAQKATIDYSNVSNEYKALFIESAYYTSQTWTLVAEAESDTAIVVKSTGKTFNGSGAPVENHQEFGLKKRNGEWKITNSYKVLEEYLDFEVVDNQWDFYWDREKHKILQELKEKLKLKILVPAHSGYFSYETRQGKLKLINDSDYDIKGVKILIEHFDSKGNSVNTDQTSVWDIIRKHGYREFDWYTSDCSQCARQEFKINFITESN